MADFSYIELTGFGLATILPRRSADKNAIDVTLDLPLVHDALARQDDDLTLLATGPGQWLAYAQVAKPGWVERLEERFAPVAHVIDQSGGYAIFALSGEDAARLLQKGLSIDLAEDAFGVNAVAVSVIAHIGVILHRTGPASFHIATFRSFAGSFRHWLDASAASL